MRYGCDASSAEIAIALGISENAVRSLLKRIRDQLRTCVKRRITQ